MDGYPERQPLTLAGRRIAEAFVLAMRAEVAEAPYSAPFAARWSRTEWVIVSRWGADAECLSLSRTGVAADDGPAPDSLQPRETFFGLRTACDDLEPCFLLLRQLPPGTPVAGSFLPADGFVRLSGPMLALRLSGAGRHAHVRGHQDGVTVYGDVPWPPLGTEGAAAWSISALRHPWLGEFIERPVSAARR